MVNGTYIFPGILINATVNDSNLSAKTVCLFSEAVVRICSVKMCLRPTTLLKKRLWHRCFPMNFAKFLKTPFLIEHLPRLLLVFAEQMNVMRDLHRERVN